MQAPNRRNGFTVTYDIVTPESAEIGDAAERGFVQPGEWKHETDSVEWDRDGAALTLSLGEALGLISCVEDCGDGSAYYETDGRQDFRSGANETRALHLPRNVSAGSKARIRRFLQSRRLL